MLRSEDDRSAGGAQHHRGDQDQAPGDHLRLNLSQAGRDGGQVHRGPLLRVQQRGSHLRIGRHRRQPPRGLDGSDLLQGGRSPWTGLDSQQHPHPSRGRRSHPEAREQFRNQGPSHRGRSRKTRGSEWRLQSLGRGRPARRHATNPRPGPLHRSQDAPLQARQPAPPGRWIRGDRGSRPGPATGLRRPHRRHRQGL